MSKHETVEMQWAVNKPSGTVNFTLEQLGCKNKEEWEKIPLFKQFERLQKELDKSSILIFAIADTWK